MTTPINHSQPPDTPSFDELLADVASGNAPPGIQAGGHDISELERAAASLHAGLTPRSPAPAALKAKLLAQGRAAVGGSPAPKLTLTPAAPVSAPVARRNPLLAALPWLAVAAAVGLAVYTGYQSSQTLRQRDRQLADASAELASMRERVKSNDELLVAARARATQLETELAQSATSMTEQQQRLAQADAKALELAERLAALTSDFDQARLKIAAFEKPVDPAELQQNRQKLMQVPGTVRLAWAPFDLPDAPAEQRLVKGDVVWNDDLQQGFLRFEGLAVNDPTIEQYQVWVIDERGLEQKVSGGVFNASAQGEVIVPIYPGIDVGRVALFAITVEKPGGTWVPDLQRRVVVAPRGEG